tara:strand:- start:239 stop:649 length:411 start_codon:yes stop_codon:yes gene_type:complete
MSDVNLWLGRKTSIYSEITNKEYITNVFSSLYEWLRRNNRLYLKYTPSETLTYLYMFIYNKNIFPNISCGTIDIYFTSDIIDLYFDIDEKYGVFLLEERGINSDDLLIFLNHMTYFYEDDNINEEDEMIYSDEIIM